MRKIPTLFVRDFTRDNGRYVTDEVTPGCEWVLAGEGEATRKYDGTCVMFDGERWRARREVKAGKAEPPGFVAVEHDDETGKTVGWEPVAQSSFARYHAEVLARLDGVQVTHPVGTYELVGPKINGNPERRDQHELVRHETAEKFGNEYKGHNLADFGNVRASVLQLARDESWEGIVWHHPDGRMAKIKARDFRPDLGGGA